MSNSLALLSVIAIIVFCFVATERAFAQDSFANWSTYVDPSSRFTIFYPPELQLQGRENFLSSVDVTLANPDFARPFKITLTYNDDDSSLIKYVQGVEISPENYLLALEDQLKASYKTYNLLDQPTKSDELYGFPTVSNIADYTNYLGESGRTMNTLAVINGKGSFLFSYSNSIEDFYKYLPTVNQIIKSLVILK